MRYNITSLLNLGADNADLATNQWMFTTATKGVYYSLPECRLQYPLTVYVMPATAHIGKIVKGM